MRGPSRRLLLTVSALSASIGFALGRAAAAKTLTTPDGARLAAAESSANRRESQLHSRTSRDEAPAPEEQPRHDLRRDLVTVFAIVVMLAAAGAATVELLPSRDPVSPPGPLQLRVSLEQPVEAVKITLRKQSSPAETWHFSASFQYASDDALRRATDNAAAKLTLVGPFEQAPCEVPPGLKTMKERKDACQSSDVTTDLSGYCTKCSGLVLHSRTSVVGVKSVLPNSTTTRYRADTSFGATLYAPPGSIGFATNGRDYRASFPTINLLGASTTVDLELSDTVMPFADIEWTSLSSPSLDRANSATWRKPGRANGPPVYAVGVDRRVSESDQRRTFFAGIAAGVAGALVIELGLQLVAVLTPVQRRKASGGHDTPAVRSRRNKSR